MEVFMLHLISDKLVELVEKHTDEILKRWTTRLLSDPTAASFSGENLNYIEKKARFVLKNLGKWVSYDTIKEDVGRNYADQGIELFKMRIPLCEVIRAMYVLRRTLWLFVQNESAFDSAFQLHQMRELNERVILFFDRAEFYVIRGYNEEMNRKMKELWNLTAEDTEKIFFDSSFYNQ
jgi:hypothetical protein